MLRQTSLTRSLFFIFSLLVCTASAAQAANKGNLRNFPQQLPEFVLQDPHGKRYDSKDLKKKNLIVVVTAPTLKNQDAQEGWDQLLEKATKPKDVVLVFLEDMKPSKFKERARKSMKDESKSGQEPILLIDPKGEITNKFKVPDNETYVLVYKQSGDLVYVETNKPTKAGADRICKSLAGK